MDLITVLIISTFLFFTAGFDKSTLGPNIREDTFSAPTSNTSRDCPCPQVPPTDTSAPTSISSSPAPVLGLLTVNWTSTCKGSIYLIPHPPFNFSSLPVCHSQKKDVWTVLKNVCQNKKGCEGMPSLSKGSIIEGYDITERGATKTSACEMLSITCKVEVEKFPDVRGQLKAYKVVTALLCCMLLILLLIRFTRPTVKALQKRFSDRRQNRWIGPTQSHSVSYHRGKSAIKNNDGDKRLSYPALERLTISDSREF